jgi:hypothetical protein
MEDDSSSEEEEKVEDKHPPAYWKFGAVGRVESNDSSSFSLE